MQTSAPRGDCSLALLVDPVLAVARPGDDLRLREPERDLLLGVLHRVRAVANVATHLDRVVAADRAGQRLLRVGRPQHRAAHLDRVGALPDHALTGPESMYASSAGKNGFS